MRSLSSLLKNILVILVSGLSFSCANINQNYSLLTNHFSILKKAKSISDLKKNDSFNPDLKKRLELIQEIKSFAVKNLSLRKTSSYSTYLDLGREALVWNVLSVKKNSLKLDNWCYFIAGCFSYKSFYEKEKAKLFSDSLVKTKNREVAIIPIAAYSTLGWSDIFGGDPVLNTFIWNDEESIVRLIIHEMSHQKVFVNNDTVFNESLATFVEEKGVKAWYEKLNDDDAYYDYLKKKANRIKETRFSKRLKTS
jgi:predicted aminopeptidase